MDDGCRYSAFALSDACDWLVGDNTLEQTELEGAWQSLKMHDEVRPYAPIVRRLISRPFYQIGLVSERP